MRGIMPENRFIDNKVWAQQKSKIDSAGSDMDKVQMAFGEITERRNLFPSIIKP